MKKPNYNMERRDRELTKQAKAAAKVEKRAVKSDEDRKSDVSTTGEHIGPDEAGGQKSRE